MSFMKAGIDDFRSMRDKFKGHADAIDTMVKSVEGMLGSSVWDGQAKTRFMGDWNTIHKPNLMKLRTAHQDMSSEMESRRQWTEEFEKAGARKS
jgi:uncharacterized protein YukE